MSKRVGILVGGGDVPGLNVCLKSLVYRLVDEGFVPIGIRKGWEGLINYNIANPTTYGDNFIELSKSIVHSIDQTPGSFLHASRFNPLRTPRKLVPKFFRETLTQTKDLTPHIADVLQELRLYALIVIGDADTLQYAAYLGKKGIPVTAIPKTIHNNIYGTDYTIGFSTGLARGVAIIHELRALAASREQVIVVESFGAGSGLSALMMAFLAEVDRAIIPEVPYDPEKLAWLTMYDKKSNPHNYAVVTVSDRSRIVSDKILKYTPHLSPRSKSAVLRMMTAEKAEEARIDAEHEFTLEEVVEMGSSLAGSGMIAAELLGYLMDEKYSSSHSPICCAPARPMVRTWY